MLNKFKSKFKSFLLRYRKETELIKECNSKTPLHKRVCDITSFICFLLILLGLIFSFPSSAAEAPLPEPADLTGYTVSVPDDWSVTSGQGLYFLEGYVSSYYGTYTLLTDHSYNYNLGLGYHTDGSFTPEADYIALYVDMHSGSSINIPSGEGFSISVTGGTDSSNTDLINWLYSVDATFELTEPSDPDLMTISSGYYKLADLPSLGVPSVGGFSPGIIHQFETPVEVIYSTGAVKQYNYFGFVVSDFQDSNNFSVDFVVQLLDVGNTVRIANLTASEGVCTSQFYGGISNIYFSDSFSIDDLSAQLILFTFSLDSSYIPDDPVIPDLPNYNPWAYILEMIIEALKVPLFGYFSIWDIYVTMCGIFILTWLLKLLAGG